MDSLISGDILKPISDLGIELLNKIEKATGWFFSTETAKKEGYKNIIDEISKREDINPIERAIIISDFNKIKREYRNKAQIINKAIKLLEQECSIDKVDNDWLFSFFEFCKNISNEEMQYVWAKILANECKDQQYNSFKLLRLLSEITNKEIDIIMKVVKGCNVDVEPFRSIGILCLNNEYLRSINLKYEDIINLEDFGIMKREIFIKKDIMIFTLEDTKVKFIRKEEKKSKLNLNGNANFYRFTNIGMEILELVNVEQNKNQFEKLEKALSDEYYMVKENIG